jgi:predicted anti-sigma-YlaC factor YlaD
MLIPVPPSDCVRAREAASRRLDDELTELESTRLDAHLRRCPACRELVGQVAAITQELRRAPLESATVTVFTPRRRRAMPALRVPALAAAIAAAALIGGGSFTLGREIAGSGSGGGSPALTASTPIGNVTKSRDDSLAQRLLALLPGLRQRQATRTGTAVPL